MGGEIQVMGLIADDIVSVGKREGMLESWLWGPTPEGFKKVSWHGGPLMLIQGWMDGRELASWFLAPEKERGESGRLYGRGVLRRVDIGGGGAALIRTYRHGGLLRRLTGEVFFTWPARPFSELLVTEQIRRGGIPTVEILAAVVARIWGPFYRGWLVTREIRGARDLWSALQDGISQQTVRLLLKAVAWAVRRMHGEGIFHADLNLKNILVRMEDGKIGVYIIDFDKARLYPGGIPSPLINRNLNRLLRSVQKLDSRRQYFSEEDWIAFKEYYDQGP